MDKVADGIWIAGYREACDVAALARAGVDAVLQLHGPEPDPLPLPPGPEVSALFVVDGERLPPTTLKAGITFIRAQREQGRTVLVTCGLGQSRSPVFVAAYLHEQGIDLKQAFVTLMRRRPQIMSHPVLLRSLVEYYRLPTTAEALLVELVKLRRELRSAGPAKAARHATVGDTP